MTPSQNQPPRLPLHLPAPRLRTAQGQHWSGQSSHVACRPTGAPSPSLRTPPARALQQRLDSLWIEASNMEHAGQVHRVVEPAVPYIQKGEGLWEAQAGLLRRVPQSSSAAHVCVRPPSKQGSAHAAAHLSDPGSFSTSKMATRPPGFSSWRIVASVPAARQGSSRELGGHARQRRLHLQMLLSGCKTAPLVRLPAMSGKWWKVICDRTKS